MVEEEPRCQTAVPFFHAIAFYFLTVRLRDVIIQTMKKVYEFSREVVCGFLKNRSSMFAAGLTYFSLLAVMPVLCCILVLAKTVGVDDYAKGYINTKIDSFITEIETGRDEVLGSAAEVLETEESRAAGRAAVEAFAQQAREISNSLFKRIDAFDIGTFGWIGFGFLLWTVISSLGMVEVSFNQIWNVPEERPIWKRAYSYLLLIIVVPVLATAAMSLPVMGAVRSVILATSDVTSVTKWLGEGLVSILDSWVLRTLFTFVMSTLVFAFIFWFLPNRRVSFRHAVWGGAATAILFGGWMKVCAVAQVGIAKSSALYGSFAFMPIVLAWLYMSWQIVLLGANMVEVLGRKEKTK